MKFLATKLPLIGFTIAIICTVFLSESIYSQQMTVGKSIYNDTSIPLRDMVNAPITPPIWKDGIIPVREIPIGKWPYQEDPVVQSINGQSGAGTILQNFDGIPVGTGGISVAPPDQTMDVGPNHVMEMVNSAYQIFDKNGNSLLGPFTLSNLWANFPGPWATSLNDGDPIVLYDQAADRWFASEFSLPNGGNGPEYIVIAVSQTSDPTGAWHRYGFQFTEFPDYPHYGIWPDGYYMSVNRFAPNNTGTYTVAFERDQMLNGNAAQYVTMTNGLNAGGSFLPSDWDGTVTPPVGAPNYFAAVSGGNSLIIYEFHVDWVNTANSTWTGPVTIPVAPYTTIDNIQQLGTTNTLDGLSPRLMNRLQYRNFGTHQSMVTCHNVDAGGSRAGMRWYEVRNTGAGWTLYQQGTYAPADGQERWMGSIAMNGVGDIALGYSVSSSTISPQIRYTGRFAADPLGTMTVTEGTIFAGAGSQTGTNRWGDYSQMSVDPADDNTFWFVQEYIPANGSFNWRTRIASFTLGAGPPPPTGVLVWEGVLGGQDYSGAFINTFLQGAGKTTTYTSTFPASLLGYESVFLSFGNYGTDGSTSVVFDNTMATAVQTYLEAGGKCYLEGGDALGFDQAANTTLLNLFGLSGGADGGTNVIDGLNGQAGALTNGMSFTSSTQVQNAFIDQYTAGTGAVAFNESGYGDVAVQYDGTNGQKTFCFSYALANLVDGTTPSTKNDLMTAILTFLKGTVAPPPDISIAPTNFTFNVAVGGNDNSNLTISNVAAGGSQDLNWNITDQPVVMTLGDGTEIPVLLSENKNQNYQGIRGQTIADKLAGDCLWLGANPTNGIIAAGNNQNVTVTVDATGLTAGTYNCTLAITSNDPDQSTINIPVQLNVTGGGGEVLVWEGALGGEDYSGAFINTFLQGAGKTTTYTSTFPTSLLSYESVFLSFGNYGADPGENTVFDNTMAAALQAYLEAGGKCYLEGGDALGFDQAANTTLLNLFGLSGSADGGTNVIDGLNGQAGALTNGMSFTASTQVKNAFIDQYTAGTGAVAFNESGYGDVAVQYDGANGQKTFCFSYALANLVDGTTPSTKNDLMTAILTFLKGTVAPPPDISIAPTNFTFNVAVGGNDNSNLTISNVAAGGSQDLNWNITDQPAVMTLGDGTEIPVLLSENKNQNYQGIRGQTIAEKLGGDCLWLSANPTNGIIAAGNNQNVTVTVDATGLTAGTYNCTLQISSNDPDEQNVIVPVELNVTGGGSVVANVTCVDAGQGTNTSVGINVDMSNMNPPDQLLGSFTATLNYDPALLDYTGNSGIQSGFTGVVNVDEGTGLITFNGANATGVGGVVTLLDINFDVIGPVGNNYLLDLEFSAMSAAISFTDLLPFLTVNDGNCMILPPGFTGDVNGDDQCNSTDALIMLSFDVGLPLPPDYVNAINTGFGDANCDGLTNSTDALIMLSFDVGLPVPFPVCDPFAPCP